MHCRLRKAVLPIAAILLAVTDFSNSQSRGAEYASLLPGTPGRKPITDQINEDGLFTHGTVIMPAACGGQANYAKGWFAATGAMYWKPGINPSEDNICNHLCVLATARRSGKSVRVPVKDKCVDCDEDQINFSERAFQQLAREEFGSWKFVSCDAGDRLADEFPSPSTLGDFSLPEPGRAVLPGGGLPSSGTGAATAFGSEADGSDGSDSGSNVQENGVDGAPGETGDAGTSGNQPDGKQEDGSPASSWASVAANSGWDGPNKETSTSFIPYGKTFGGAMIMKWIHETSRATACAQSPTGEFAAIASKFFKSKDTKKDEICTKQNLCIELLANDGKTKTVMVRDKCDNCNTKTFQITKSAFKYFADLSAYSLEDMTIRYVRCDQAKIPPAPIPPPEPPPAKKVAATGGNSGGGGVSGGRLKPKPKQKAQMPAKWTAHKPSKSSKSGTKNSLVAKPRSPSLSPFPVQNPPGMDKGQDSGRQPTAKARGAVIRPNKKQSGKQQQLVQTAQEGQQQTEGAEGQTEEK